MAWAAAKIYRPRQSRRFQNDAIYTEGRRVGDARLRRAVKNKSRKGRAEEFGLWLGQEYQILRQLFDRGTDVPRPISSAGSAILMEYLGDGNAPAPQLSGISLTAWEARRLLPQVITNIELLLSCGWVHGDLSEFNMLYRHGKVWLIDFPQAVDAIRNRHAYTLLQRDLENVCAYFADTASRRMPKGSPINSGPASRAVTYNPQQAGEQASNRHYRSSA